MRKKTQKGGFRQTASERQLWLATTPEKKAYWRSRVQTEKALTGGSIKDKLKTAGMVVAPVVAAALMGALAHKIQGNHAANKAWDKKLADRMDYYKRNNIM